MRSTQKRWIRIVAVMVSVSVLLIAMAMMTTSAFAVLQCISDVDGANDEPGQKDLTQSCVDYANFPNPLVVTWNWDETGTNGANTLDACALFDTDGDGNANNAVCATTTGDPATLVEYVVLSCNNTRPDRCAGYALLPTPAGTTCTITSPSPDDPFPDGSSSPDDTKAECAIDVSDLATNPILIDVCSYPSLPNSDPSDCVARANSGSQLIVRKVTNPAISGHVFDFSISSVPPINFTLSNGQTYATHPGELMDGPYTIAETPATDWATSISCVDPAGAVVATVEDGTSVDVTLTGSTISCTFTNTAGPTSVQLADFSGAVKPDHILLSWETVSEIDNLGFNVYRSDAAAGAQSLISTALIPANNPGATQGSTYSFQDAAVQPGVTYYYWLEDLDTAGQTSKAGPVAVTFLGPTSVGLNSFTAVAGTAPALLGLGGAALAALAGLAVARRKHD